MLTKNGLLRTISERLSFGGSLDEVMRRFRDSPAYTKGGYDERNLTGKLAPLHLRVALEDVAAEFDGLVEMDPLQDRERMGDFEFRYVGGTGGVLYNRYGNIFTSIGEILIVGGLPVVFKISIGKYSRRGSNGKRDHRRARGSQELLYQERISYFSIPLAGHFSIDGIGYCVVLPRNNIKTSGLQREFQECGGILKPMHATQKEYASEILVAAKKFGILN